MAQHDYVIANGTGAAVRSDLNNALAAIVSNNSGATEPATMYAYQWWADTTTGLLKLRNAANNAWITLRELDGTLTIEDGTASSPGLAFADDLNTGIYSPSADQLGITTGGTVRLTTTTTAITSALPVDVPLGTASAPTVTFTGDLDTGIYSPGANQVAISTNGSGRLFVDSSGRVGVGTSSPAAPLHVSGTDDILRLTATDPYLSFYNGATRTGYIRSDATNSAFNIVSENATSAMRFYTNNTVRAVIDSSGRLGIGSTTPSDLLTVNGADQSIMVRTSNAAGTALVKFNADDTNYARVGLENTALVFRCSNSSTPTERARIDSSGRLLVGTSTSRNVAAANQRLIQVESASGDGGISVVRNSNDTVGGRIVIGKSRGTSVGSNTILQSGDDLGGLIFAGADGTDLQSWGAQILAEVDGTPGTDDLPTRLVFSTTADGASSPTERMRINNSGRTFFFDSGGATLSAASSRTANTSDYIFIGTYSATGIDTGTTSIRIYTNGNVQNTNNSYGAISDLKLKENIVNATSQWDDIKALQVRKYNFKEGQTHTQIGLIAQEVEQVSPGLVTESPDRDEEGNDLGTVTKSVNYSVLYMKAVKALQEAMERIETLEQRLADAGIA